MAWSRRIWGYAAALLLLAAGVGGIYLALRYGPLRLGPAARARLGAAAPCTLEGRSRRGDCYQQAFTATVRSAGVAGAIAALQAVALVDRDANRNGHVYAHGIGIEGFQHLHNVPAAFDHCPVDFASGCGHGVIQAYLESQSEMDSATVNGLCTPYRKPGQPMWQLFQCVHGMGHGLDMMYRGNLPHALRTCDLLGDGWDRASCYGGAFMENIMEEIAPHHPASELAASHDHDHMGMDMGEPTFKRLDRTQPLYPCSIMETKYLQPCYEIQTAAILHYNRGSIRKTSEICDTAPDAMRPICYLSLGRDITSKAGRSPARTRRYCDQSGEKYRKWCYFGAAKALVDWGAQAEPGLAFCGVLGNVRGSLFCYQAVGEQIRALVGPEPERAALCAGITRKEALEACRYGAGIPGSTLPRDEG
ncbi:MAG TPA: hypothetical protein VFU23_16510 [Gemmatimonadales bacterium]|nr:hypothetical protein [Gemmatimonadales bacterium]